MTALLWIIGNWRVVAIAMLLCVPSLYAAVVKHQRDSARATIKEMVAAGKLQEERTKAEIARQQAITKGVDDEHKKRAARIRDDNKRLSDELRTAASRSLVPALPNAPGVVDDGIACFDRGALNAVFAGVFQRYAERLTGIALEGESVSAAFAAGQEWAMKLEPPRAYPPPAR